MLKELYLLKYLSDFGQGKIFGLNVMYACVCVCRTLPEMMFCFEDVDARPLCVLSIVRHTFFERESNAMSEQFRTGEGKLFHGLAQPHKEIGTLGATRSQLFEIDEEGMEIGQFSYALL